MNSIFCVTMSKAETIAVEFRLGRKLLLMKLLNEYGAAASTDGSDSSLPGRETANEAVDDPSDTTETVSADAPESNVGGLSGQPSTASSSADSRATAVRPHTAQPFSRQAQEEARLRRAVTIVNDLLHDRSLSGALEICPPRALGIIPQKHLPHDDNPAVTKELHIDASGATSGPKMQRADNTIKLAGGKRWAYPPAVTLTAARASLPDANPTGADGVEGTQDVGIVATMVAGWWLGTGPLSATAKAAPQQMKYTDEVLRVAVDALIDEVRHQDPL